MRSTVVALLGTMMACSPASESVPSVTRSDSSGVSLVRHSGLDSTVTWSVSAEPILEIGEVDGDQPYVLTTVLRVQRLQDGSIIVVESRDSEIRIFDPSGRHVRSIGRAGEGPGEFRSLGWVQVIRGDSLLAWDSQLRRMTIFSAAGEIGRILSPRITEGVSFWVARAAFPDASLEIVPYAGPGEYELGTLVDERLVLARWRSSAPESLDTIVQFPLRSTYIDREARLWPVPFMPTVAEAATSNGIISTPGGSFTVDRHGLDGSHISRLTVDLHPDPIHPEALQAYRDDRLSGARDDAARAELERRLDELPFPSQYPVLDRVLEDDLEAVWVRLYNPAADDPQEWHVFSASGDHLARVQTPGGFEVHSIDRDVILGRWTDSMGVRTVRIYALSRTPT